MHKCPNSQNAVWPEIYVDGRKMNIFTLVFRPTAGVQGINLWFEDLKICAGRIKGAFLTFINISSYVCCPNNPLPYESKKYKLSIIHLFPVSIKQFRSLIQISSRPFLNFRLVEKIIKKTSILYLWMHTFSLASCFSSFFTSTRDALGLTLDIFCL